MIILLEVLGVLFLIGFLSGYKGSHYWNFSIGLNTFAYPAFECGISSRYEFTDDDLEVQIVTIGCVLFVIEFEFFKPFQEED